MSNPMQPFFRFSCADLEYRYHATAMTARTGQVGPSWHLATAMTARTGDGASAFAHVNHKSANEQPVTHLLHLSVAVGFPLSLYLSPSLLLFLSPCFSLSLSPLSPCVSLGCISKPRLYNQIGGSQLHLISTPNRLKRMMLEVVQVAQADAFPFALGFFLALPA